MATYSCNPGFGLSGGDGTRTCGGDGSSPTGAWSGTPSTCECMQTSAGLQANLICSNFTVAITCSTLDAIPNGAIVYSPDTIDPFDFETNATYSCNEGFYLEGESIRTCIGDGSSVSGVWNGITPVCTGMFTKLNLNNLCVQTYTCMFICLFHCCSCHLLQSCCPGQQHDHICHRHQFSI